MEEVTKQLIDDYKMLSDIERIFVDHLLNTISISVKGEWFKDQKYTAAEFKLDYSSYPKNMRLKYISIFLNRVLANYGYKTNLSPNTDIYLIDYLTIYKTKDSKIFDYEELEKKLKTAIKEDDKIDPFIISAKKALEISNSDNHQIDSEYSKSKLIKEKIFEIGAKIFKAARNGDKKLVYDCNFSDKDDVIEYIVNHLRKEGYNVIEKTIPFADCRYEAETCKYFIISWDKEGGEE